MVAELFCICESYIDDGNTISVQGISNCLTFDEFPARLNALWVVAKLRFDLDEEGTHEAVISSATSDMDGAFGELSGTLDEPATVNVPLFPEQYGTRRLMAADIVLHVDHIGIRTDTYFADPSTGNLVIHSPGIIETPDRYPYRLDAVPLFTPPQYPTALDRLMGAAVEPNYDALLIATLWLVSPPDEPDDTVPGPTWAPYPQHFVFWNLGYANVNQLNYTLNEPITIHTGLAFGLLDSIGNTLLAPINDATQDALNPNSEVRRKKAHRRCATERLG